MDTLIIPNSTVYRNVSDELVVIQLETGRFYYFTADTKEFLDYFQQPRSLESLGDGEEQEDPQYLKNFCKFLLEKKILEVSDAGDSGPALHGRLAKPTFLREGEKTLDEITFLCP
ncbi:MAG: hypothetical protein KDD51_12975 [Bdellovibrionales bacterium]|nr:hypothetical protein [Bdellovibrionales bacterium]